MYAVVETGAKQYKVSKGDIIEVELLKGAKAGSEVNLDKILLLSDGDNVEVGLPYLNGKKSVLCKVVGEKKAKKVVAFKFKRRKSSQTKKGHRQKYTQLEVKEIK